MSEALQLPNKTNCPPGGWKYRVPQTGQWFEGPSLANLIDQLKAHYAANGYDVPGDLEQKIEDSTCARMPDYCTGNNPAPLKPQLALTFHTVVQGSKTLLSWFANGREFVSTEKAEKRASVCAGCQFNEPPEGCTGCNIRSLRALVEKLVGGRKTSLDSRLKSCRVCYCQLAAKVWLPQPILWRHMEDEQKERLPAHCWLVTEGNMQ